MTDLLRVTRPLAAMAACAVVLAGVTLWAAEGPAEPKTAQEVVARMAEAREAVRTATYEVRTQHRYAAPVYYEIDDPWGGPLVVTDEVIVPAGVRTLRTERFAFDGPRYRHEWEGIHMSMLPGLAGRGLTPSRSLMAYDGRRSMAYYPGDNTCIIEAGPQLRQALDLRPLMQFHYGLLPVGDGELRLEGKEDWEGRACFRLSNEDAQRRYTYLVDPERDWTLVRETWEALPGNDDAEAQAMAGRRARPIEIEFAMDYTQGEGGPRRLSGWTFQFWRVLDEGRDLDFVDTVVVEEATLNEPVPADTFMIDPPDGCHVEDRIRGTQYVQGEEAPAEHMP